jgi:hypothetical protein
MAAADGRTTDGEDAAAHQVLLLVLRIVAHVNNIMCTQLTLMPHNWLCKEVDNSM